MNECVFVHVCINVAYKIGFFEVIFCGVLRRFMACESKHERQRWMICDSLEGGFVRIVVEV